MDRSQLLDDLARQIGRIERPRVVRVAIDGPDAAGKSTLADELVAPLETLGRTVIRGSTDTYHNPKSVRYQRGAASPKGYYHDSFNYQAITETLLNPLGPSEPQEPDSEARDLISSSGKNHVLLFDGVFLLRPQLSGYWDFSIFLEVSFETVMARAERRDTALLGSIEEVRSRYTQRYIPGQQLYFAECQPKNAANIVIDNNDYDNPKYIRA